MKFKKSKKLRILGFLLCLSLINTFSFSTFTSPVFGAGVTMVISTDSSGVIGNGRSYDGSISDDVSGAAFCSTAQLDASDTNAWDDIYYKDISTGSTICLTPGSNGVSYSPQISGDGRYVAFASWSDNLVLNDTNTSMDAFVYNIQTGITTLVSTDSSGNQGNAKSDEPAITTDGRYVAFHSIASNLVPGDTGYFDVFVKDTDTGNTDRVSTDSTGGQANGHSYRPSVSADCRYVAFHSHASDLVPGDTNAKADIFVKDRITGSITRVSTDSSGGQGNQNSYDASVSSDGRYVAFKSYSSNLVTGDTNGTCDVFKKDMVTGVTTRVSTTLTGGEGNHHSESPSISAGGRYVAFKSYASNLVSGDTNGKWDVFVKDTQAGYIMRVSVTLTGEQGDNHSEEPYISPSGHYIAFHSNATNLISGDTNNNTDVFLAGGFSLDTSKVALIRQNAVNGNQRLFIYNPPAGVGGDIGSPVANDNWIGNINQATNITGVASADFDGDDVVEIIMLREDPVSGAQRLTFHEMPVVVGGDTGPPFATDGWVGNANQNSNVVEIVAGDYDGDTAPEIGLVRQRTDNGNQSFWVYEVPTTVGGDIGSPIATYDLIGNANQNTNIITGTSGDFDGDGVSELLAIRQRADNGNQSLRIYEPPSVVGDTPGLAVASDFWIGKAGTASNVTQVTAGDFDGDSVIEIAIIRQNPANNNQRLSIYEVPSSVGGDLGPPIATDPWIGNTNQNTNAVLMSSQ